MLKFEEALGQYAYLSTPILRVLYEMANATDTERVHVEGVTKLFSYPEFNNVTKAKDVLELMGEREKFTAMLTDADPEKANVFIGGDDADSQQGFPRSWTDTASRKQKHRKTGA